MSKKWVKSHDIPVNGAKTVQEVYNGAGGRTNNPVVNYVTAKTCIGAAEGAEKALKNVNRNVKEKDNKDIQKDKKKH